MESEDKYILYSKQHAEALLRKAKYGRFGIFWRLDQNGQYYDTQFLMPNYSLYNGACGILLFFIELYKVDHDAKHLSVLHDCARWLHHQSIVRPTPGFYAGCDGVIYVMMELYRITGDQVYIGYTDDILAAKQSTGSPDRLGLFGGMAGELLALTHLITVRNSENAWNLLKQKVTAMLSCAQAVNNALYWNERPTGFENPAFLCGNRGVAYALEQVCVLCDDAELRNMNAAVRKLIRSSDLKSEMMKYYGIAGEGMALLVTGDKEAAKLIADKILADTGTRIVSDGLFGGKTGIAYFLMKIMNGGTSVIDPGVTPIDRRENVQIVSDVKQLCVNRSFPLATDFVRGNIRGDYYYDRLETLELKQKAMSPDFTDDKIFNELVSIELIRNRIEYDRLIAIPRLNPGGLSFDRLMKSRVMINPAAEMINTVHHSELFGSQTIYICPTVNGTKIFPLTKTDLELLDVIKESAYSSGKVILKEFISRVDYSDRTEVNRVKAFFLEQMRVYVMNEFVIVEL